MFKNVDMMDAVQVDLLEEDFKYCEKNYKSYVKLVFLFGRDALKQHLAQDKLALQTMGAIPASKEQYFVPSTKSLYVLLAERAQGESLQDLRSAAANAIRFLYKLPTKLILIPNYETHKSSGEWTAAIVEGLLLGGYSFNKYKNNKEASKKYRGIDKILICLGEQETEQHIEINSISKRLVEIQALAKGVNITRSFVNCSPSDIYPQTLAQEAQKLADEFGLSCKVLGVPELQRERMNALLAVARASVHEPRLIHMTYKPAKPASKKIVFVGKGLTYDAGGMSLKSAASMLHMKSDKAGACSIIGLLTVIARLGLACEVHGVLGAVENMIGNDAYKPDDILIARDATSIEVKNTDAEGRLVLADCLSYAQDLEPDYIIDIATLTGACINALGQHTIGIMGNSLPLKDALLLAAESSGELAGYLPFNEHLRSLLKSSIADIANIGRSPKGGAITAALFLDSFIRKEYKDKWFHLDIAGPSFVDEVWDVNPVGASGASVRMLYNWLTNI